MIWYNVTLKVDREVTGQWVEWMMAEHMPDLMRTGLFADCRLGRLLDQDEHDGITYVAQYACAGRDQYEQYIAQYADEMRARANQRFGGKFVAFRSLIEMLEPAK